MKEEMRKALISSPRNMAMHVQPTSREIVGGKLNTLAGVYARAGLRGAGAGAFSKLFDLDRGNLELPPWLSAFAAALQARRGAIAGGRARTWVHRVRDSV